MSVSRPYDDRLMADLAAAADGALPAARERELAARAQRDPELAAALDDQRRAQALIRAAAAEVRASAALRERLGELRPRW
jgi:anti-sigma factor RsiW